MLNGPSAFFEGLSDDKPQLLNIGDLVSTIDDPMAKLHNHYGEIVGVQGVALGATVRSEDIPEFHNGNSFGLDGSELGTFEVGPGPYSVLFDGESIWVTKDGGDTISKLAR